MDKIQAKQSLVTAYENNTRQSLAQRPAVVSDWGDKIDKLLRLDHSFLGYVYSSGGLLFRAMADGLLQAIEHDRFAAYQSDNPHAALEAELDVYFLSHELSDGLTIARLWEDIDDAGLLCVFSDYFNQKNQRKKAAVMAFSEPGFVFKYPFLTEPLRINDLHCIFVNSLTYQRIQHRLNAEQFARIETILRVIDQAAVNGKRHHAQDIISDQISQDKLAAATPIMTKHYPKNNYS